MVSWWKKKGCLVSDNTQWWFSQPAHSWLKTFRTDFQSRDLASLFYSFIFHIVSTQRVVEWTHNNKLCAHTYKESWLLHLTFSSSCGVEQKEPFCPWPLIALGKLQQQHLRPLLNLRTRAFQNRVAPSPLSELRSKGKYSVKAPQEDSFLILAYWVGQDQIGLRPVWAESCLQLCSTNLLIASCLFPQSSSPPPPRRVFQRLLTMWQENTKQNPNRNVLIYTREAILSSFIKFWKKFIDP